MTAPLFSNTCTHSHWADSSATWLIQVVITASMAGSSSSGRVLPWSGEKQMTRLVPRAASSFSRGSCSPAAAGCPASGRRSRW